MLLFIHCLLMLKLCALLFCVGSLSCSWCPFWYYSDLAVEERAGCFTLYALRLAVFCVSP